MDFQDRIIRVGLVLLACLVLLCFRLALAGSDGRWLIAPTADLVLVSYSSQANEFFSSCDGIVENRSGHTMTTAEIGFSLTDRSGAVVGTARDVLRSPLPPGGRWSFQATCFRSAPGGTSKLAYLVGN